jgi:YfiR/HmsC-like
MHTHLRNLCATALGVALLLGLGTPGVRAADAAASREELIKAAILYNFARFTEWPQHALAAGAEFRLCVLGADSFVAALGSIEGRPVQGRPVVVAPIEGWDRAASCNLLYLGAAEAVELPQRRASLGNAPILLVAEFPEFSRSGGHIEMLAVDDRVRFGINQALAEQTGLTFSAKLLGLADRSIDGASPERVVKLQ